MNPFEKRLRKSIEDDDRDQEELYTRDQMAEAAIEKARAEAELAREQARELKRKSDRAEDEAERAYQEELNRGYTPPDINH